MSDRTAVEKRDPRAIGRCGSQAGRRNAPTPSLARPAAADGAAIWRLVRAAGTLEPNSAYAYMLLGAHFSATSIVARRGEEVAGFVWAYLLPDRPDTLFVWQVGVAESSRGHGFGAAMLDGILRRPSCAGARFLEATVTPTNDASTALFRSFARRRDAPIALSTAFDASQFPDPQHETEMLVRIGPFHPISQIGSNPKEDTT
jgi:L-2,4-diaminobutyric acid acetyltransferase